MGSVKRLVRILDENVSAWVEFSFMYLMLFGFKHGIFKLTGTYTKREELESSLPKTNEVILNRALDAYITLGVMDENDGIIRIGHPPNTPNLPWEKLDALFSDWVPILEETYRMADYAFLSDRHPRMILDFDKGSDFWDMKLSQGINTLYRDILVKITELKDGMTVLDLGCGSVSPVEIGRHVGPNGRYVGVDFSVGLLSIARERIKKAGMDWVELKNMDVRNVLPSRKYDVVVMSFILEYFRDQEGILRKGLKFLDAGGKLVIVDPFREEYEHIAAWEFFEGFTPEFVAFPRRETVKIVAEEEGLSYKEFGKNIILIQ